MNQYLPNHETNETLRSEYYAKISQVSEPYKRKNQRPKNTLTSYVNIMPPTPQGDMSIALLVLMESR